MEDKKLEVGYACSLRGTGLNYIKNYFDVYMPEFTALKNVAIPQMIMLLIKELRERVNNSLIDTRFRFGCEIVDRVYSKYP